MDQSKLSHAFSHACITDETDHMTVMYEKLKSGGNSNAPLKKLWWELRFYFHTPRCITICGWPVIVSHIMSWSYNTVWAINVTAACPVCFYCTVRSIYSFTATLCICLVLCCPDHMIHCITTFHLVHLLLGAATRLIFPVLTTARTF